MVVSMDGWTEHRSIDEIIEKERIMARRISRVIDTEQGIVTFRVNGADVLIARLDNYSPSIQRRLTLHGLSQKIGDAAAGITDAEEICRTLASVEDMLQAGKWGAERAPGKPRVTLLAEAIARVKQSLGQDRTPGDVQKKLDAMDRKEKAEVRKHPAVRKAMEDIRAERAKSVPDDAVLEDL